ncbi:MAG: SLBB domain-containing protein, partial [Chitinophagaceae bacterium]
EAESGRIEISSIVDTVTKYNIESHGSVNKIVAINPNLEIDEASEQIVIRPMDIVFVRRKSDFLEQHTVKILGEVNYPGDFVLLNNSESLSSIIERAGGLKSEAYLAGAKVYRKNVGQVVVSLQDALKNKKSKFDLILKNEDIIIIPQINDIVSVKGAVQHEVNMKYDADNKNIKHYISAAGGYGERPWKKRITVKYANGKVKETKNYLFYRKYPRITEGAVVEVPTKPKKDDKVNLSEIISYTLTTLTTLTTLIILGRSL